MAAVTQITTGILGTSGVQAVFLVGFGWQGAISGVAGVPARLKLSSELEDCGRKRAQDRTELERRRGEVERKLAECGKIREELQAELNEIKTTEKGENRK